MSDTKLNSPPAWAAGVRVAAAAALGALLLVLAFGCKDTRKEPLTPAEPGYTQTIELWDKTPVGPNGIASASFTITDSLAAINTPGVDTPARLNVAAFIVPDCQIYRRLQILQDSIPYLQDSVIIRSLVLLTPMKNRLDSLQKVAVDSLEGLLRVGVDSLAFMLNTSSSAMQLLYRGRTIPCDTPLFGMVPLDSLHGNPDLPGSAIDVAFGAINDTLAQLERAITAAQVDVTRLGAELSYLGDVLDTRYFLSIALDNTDVFYIPNAHFTDAAGHVEGQEIFAAAIDTTTGLIGRGFTLSLDRFQAADISHLGHTFEVNWATCFTGSNRPCLGPGTHTIYVHIAGAGSKVTGSIVLVYAQRV